MNRLIILLGIGTIAACIAGSVAVPLAEQLAMNPDTVFMIVLIALAAFGVILTSQ